MAYLAKVSRKNQSPKLPRMHLKSKVRDKTPSRFNAHHILKNWEKIDFLKKNFRLKKTDFFPHFFADVLKGLCGASGRAGVEKKCFLKGHQS
jgi:hypothetical protein